MHRPDTIAALARAAARARDALAGARAVAALPQHAADAEAALQGGASLSTVYECVATLEGSAAAARRALAGATAETVAGGRADASRGSVTAMDAGLAPYFGRVAAAGRALEERLWATVRAARRGGRTAADRAALVDAARVLEAQDAVDRHLDAATTASESVGGSDAAHRRPGDALAPSSDPHAPRAKRWWRRAEEHVAASFADAFAPVLVAASRLAVNDSDARGRAADSAPAPPTDGDARVAAVLDGCSARVADLVALADGAAPAFPPHRGAALVAAAAAALHDGVSAVVSAAAGAAPALSNADVLRVIGWADAYAATLADAGADAPLAALPLDVEPLHGAYRARARAALATWWANSLAADLAASPAQRADGRLYTPGGADFFRGANDALASVAAVTDGDLLLDVAADTLAVMADYQLAQAAVIATAGGAGGGSAVAAAVAAALSASAVKPPSPLPALDDATLCALANNAAAAHRESAEFADRLDAALAPRLRGTPGDATTPSRLLSVDDACRGFADLASGACRTLARRVVADAALGDLCARVGAGPDWRDGAVTESLLATLADYCGDLRALLEKPLFTRVAERLLADAAAALAAGPLALARALTRADAARVRADAADLAAVFGEWARPDAVARAARVVGDVAALVDADGGDAARLAAAALLQSAPTLAPAAVDRLLAARTDLSRADRADAAAAVRDAAAAARAAGAVAPPPPRDGRVAALLRATAGAGAPAAGPAARDGAYRAVYVALRDGAAGGVGG